MALHDEFFYQVMRGGVSLVAICALLIRVKQIRFALIRLIRVN